VPTFAALGEVEGMVSNDAAIVQADETHDGGSTFYKYSGSAWEYVFTINTTPLTDEQAAAINSGITAEKVTAYDSWLKAKLSQILANGNDAARRTITNLGAIDVTNAAGEVTFEYNGGNDEFTMSPLAQGNLRQWANSFLKMNVMRPNGNIADYMYEMHAKPNFVVFVASSDGRAYLPDASTVDSASWAAVFNGWNEREWTEAVYYQPVNDGGEAVWSPQFQLVQVSAGVFDWTPGAGTQIVVWNSPKTAAGVRLDATDLKKGYIYEVMGYTTDEEVFGGGQWYLDGDGNVQQIGNPPIPMVDQVFISNANVTTVAGTAFDLEITPPYLANPSSETWHIPKGTIIKFNEGGARAINMTVNTSVDVVPEHAYLPSEFTINVTPDTSNHIQTGAPMYGKREITNYERNKQIIPDDLQDLTTIPSTQVSDPLADGIEISEFWLQPWWQAQMKVWLDMTDEELSAHLFAASSTDLPGRHGKIQLYASSFEGQTAVKNIATFQGAYQQYQGTTGSINTFGMPIYMNTVMTGDGSSSLNLCQQFWGAGCRPGIVTGYAPRATWASDADFLLEVRKYLQFYMEHPVYTARASQPGSYFTLGSRTVQFVFDDYGTIKFRDENGEPTTVKVYEYITAWQPVDSDHTVKCWR
jgi:hypothetical protein